MNRRTVGSSAGVLLAMGLALPASLAAQMIDRTQAPNLAKDGIAKSLAEEIGAGRGDVVTPDSSAFIIARDPFRAIRRGRQLFQRKFTRPQGQGPLARRRRRRRQQRCSRSARVSPTAAPLPRPSARLGRVRRRRRHAPGQPRRAAPVRPRPEGDAGGRDHAAICARSARAGDRSGARAQAAGDAPTDEQGDRLRLDHRDSERTVDTSQRRRRGPRPARAAVLRARRTRSRSASSSSAPATTRWDCTPPIRTWPRRGRRAGACTPAGHGARRRARTGSKRPPAASPTTIRTATASSTRCRQRSSTTSSSTC